MLVLDLNRGTTAGMDSMDVNAHLDGTGRGHGTNQGLMRVNGKDRGTSHARLETQEEKSHGNSMETQRETKNTPWSNQPKESMKEFTKIPSCPSSNWIHTRTKDTTVFPLTRAYGNDYERFLPTKGGGSKVGEERKNWFSLTNSQTRMQRPADPISHREQHSITSLSENR